MTKAAPPGKGLVQRGSLPRPALLALTWALLLLIPGCTLKPRPAEAAAAVVALVETEEPQLLIDARQRVANLVVSPEEKIELTKGAVGEEQLFSLTELVYQVFEDAFDFVVIVPDLEEGLPTALYFPAYLRHEGIGGIAFDRTAQFGSSGRLQGVITLTHWPQIRTGPLLHEIGHRWANRILPTTPTGHWGFAGIGGQLGGWEAGTLEELGEGHYRARFGDSPTFGLTSNGGSRLPYADLELYLMGLLPAHRVAPFEAADGGEWIDEERGEFSARRIVRITMEEIVSVFGSRSPAFGEAQSSFRTLFLVVSSEPLDPSRRDEIDTLVAWFGHEGPGDDLPNHNFWDATGGRGTMQVGRLGQVVKGADPDIESDR